LILQKITEIVATRCHILRLKCAKFDFGWAAPDPTRKRSALSAFPDQLAVFKGSCFYREEMAQVRTSSEARGEERDGGEGSREGCTG